MAFRIRSIALTTGSALDSSTFFSISDNARLRTVDDLKVFLFRDVLTLYFRGATDIASEMRIRSYRTDFGHTLAIWGFNSGPYLMVPFFGPRTVRSGTGFVFDTVASVQWNIDDFRVRAALFALEVIDNRAALTDAEELITGDRYIFIRDIYLQQRAAFVNEGVVQDTFSDFDEEFDWEE